MQSSFLLYKYWYSVIYFSLPSHLLCLPSIHCNRPCQPSLVSHTLHPRLISPDLQNLKLLALFIPLFLREGGVKHLMLEVKAPLRLTLQGNMHTGQFITKFRIQYYNHSSLINYDLANINYSCSQNVY